MVRSGMNILMFNHHPDVLRYMWRAFTELGHNVTLASEQLTEAIGFEYSSTKNNKFEVVNQLFEPGDLFPDMKDVKFTDSLGKKEYGIIWSMLPNIMMLEQHGEVTWFDAQMQAYIRNPVFQNIPSIRTCNHPQASLFKFRWVPNWTDVGTLPEIKERKYITQLITEIDKVDTTDELLEMRSRGLPVKIHGGDRCPDGFIRDVDILPETLMLVHNKKFGINCYAVCKALAMGIPVYMSEETYATIGFTDLPTSCFLMKEDYSIAEALEKVKNESEEYFENIKNTYRSIYTLDRTVSAVKEIIEENLCRIEQ